MIVGFHSGVHGRGCAARYGYRWLGRLIQIMKGRAAAIDLNFFASPKAASLIYLKVSARDSTQSDLSKGDAGP
jgi:hypothetical protein